MDLIKITIKYILKNFHCLFLAALIPAVFWGTYNTGSFFTFLFDYPALKINGFDDILKHCFGGFLFSHTWYVIAYLILGVLMFSLLTSMIENHLRTGQLNVKHPFQKINQSLTGVIMILLIGFVFIYLWQIVLSAILLLNHYIFSGLGNAPTILTIIFAFAEIILFLLLRFYFFTLIIPIAPSRLIFGYTFGDSVAYSVRLLEKHHWSMVLAVAFPFLIMFFIDFAIHLLPPVGGVVLSIFKMTMAILYFCALPMLSFFKITNIERKDIKKKFYQN